MTSLHSKKYLAFTLVELMIAVSVMVMLLALGSVAYLRYLNKQNLYQSGSAIEGLIKDARAKAQNGFLGNDEIGFCDRLTAVEVFSALNANDRVYLTAQLHCTDNSLLVYENYESNRGIEIDNNFMISFLPLSGSQLSIGGNQVASGSATMAYDDNEVILNFDQGGNIDVLYQ